MGSFSVYRAPDLKCPRFWGFPIIIFVMVRAPYLEFPRCYGFVKDSTVLWGFRLEIFAFESLFTGNFCVYMTFDSDIPHLCRAFDEKLWCL